MARKFDEFAAISRHASLCLYLKWVPVVLLQVWVAQVVIRGLEGSGDASRPAMAGALGAAAVHPPEPDPL